MVTLLPISRTRVGSAWTWAAGLTGRAAAVTSRVLTGHSGGTAPESHRVPAHRGLVMGFCS